MRFPIDSLRDHRRGCGGPDHFRGVERLRGAERHMRGHRFDRPPGGGQRARRGDVRLAILTLLADAPANGYSLIGQISDRTDGRWRPSPGSVYPVLRQLTEEGLVENEGDIHAGFTITDGGLAFVAEHADQASKVWQNGQAISEAQEQVHQGLRKLIGAVRELSESGSDEQRTKAVDLLDETRRQIYGMLAE
jgi:DNA-binding PadR family transcriptional regulator